ncbi:MAG: hypothetical protein ACKVX9_00140 [Blastocatellia bacterium]
MKSEDVNAPGNMKMTVIVWVAGVILALVIGFYGVNRMNASVQIPPTTDVGDRR